MWNFFKANGGTMIQTYFAALMEVPPRNVAETFTEAIGVLCVTFMQEPVLV